MAGKKNNNKGFKDFNKNNHDRISDKKLDNQPIESSFNIPEDTIENITTQDLNYQSNLIESKAKIVEGFNNSNLEGTFVLDQYQNITETRPIIEVKNLVKLYGNFLAIDSLNFHVQKGEVLRPLRNSAMGEGAR